MPKFLLPLVALLFCSGIFVSVQAQQTLPQAREAEWKNYALPKTNFTRKHDLEKQVIFRVPADWQQQGTSLSFKGPHDALLQLLVQKVPEGYPLDDYFAATLRVVRDAVGNAEFVVTRRTQFQDVEAREMVVDALNPEGELLRNVSWIAIHGPQAYGFNLQVPATHAAEVEPYFKGVVQSVIFASNVGLEDLRAATIKSPAPAPIDEIENIVETLSATTPQRDAAISHLAALFSSQPDVAIDLLLDRRPFVRVAAVQAAARSNNSLLTPFLWKLLDDREPLVSEAAARGVANSADVATKLLENSLFGFQTEKIARVWPFLPPEKRNALLEDIFKDITVHHDPPPPAKAPPARPSVSVKLTELAPVAPGKPPSVLTVASVASHDPNVQLGALTLLTRIPPDQFKIPFARIVASNQDSLIAVALQVALQRGEVLPVPALLKLVSSANKEVSKFAAEHLAVAATVADVPQIEALISKDGSRKESDDQLKLLVKRIRFRNTLAAAKTEDDKRALISKTLSDAELADFAWRHDCEATIAGCASGGIKPTADLAIKPLGENLFPQRLKHYAAITNPRQTMRKFYESLHGMQMDSPRSQASLVLMLTNIRKLMAQTLSAPVDADELIDYTGIDADAPIAFGSWTAPNARDSIASAERKAVVLRVKDRARFERNLDNIERVGGDLKTLIDGAGGLSRAIAVLPAGIPLTAQAILSSEPPKPSGRAFSVLRYSFLSDKEWNGLKLRVVETRAVLSDWTLAGDVSYIAYLGDTAILAPDLASLREVLTNAASDSRKLLADNTEFRQAIDSGGDIVYFSDIKAVFAEHGDTNDSGTSPIERGALKLSSLAWENSHHVAFAETDWAKPLLPFQPKELTAPRELLSASTIGYFLTKIDLAALWSSSSWNLLTKAEADELLAAWALDFKQEVLPELGPECGAVLTELPNFDDLGTATWAAFCKLKSNKLSQALTAGRLLRGVGPTTDVAEVKLAGSSYFVTTRNGFLVVSNSAKALATFDGKTNLAATRDYSRSLEKVPNGVIAFGGYNLEAAVASVTKGELEGLRGQIADVLFSFANAFHSQNFYATASAGSVEAHSSVSMDREGRYAVADFSSLPKGTGITYALIEPRGVPITDQRRLSNLVLRLRAKAPGPIDNIKDNIKSATQTVAQKSATELEVTVAARTAGAEKTIQLPVKDPELAPFIKATPEFASDKKEVIDQARQIAGDDRDAWSVARKLAAWTNKNLEWKVVISADPVDTLATREADCSEFSALFVAMARSLGLPARMVTGLAYNGSSFGGHAWVEVWAGRWIELDPTWGTSFVDATHIRDASNALVTSAALNLIELEVIEAKRTVAEFQKTPRALAEHLARVIPLRDRSELEATLDLPILVDEYMGAGEWNRLSDSEREQMWSAYRRLVSGLLAYGVDQFGSRRIRVVHLEEKDETAEAFGLTSPSEVLLKLRFVRRNGVWHLVEVVDADNDFALAAETLRPPITAIQKVRAGEKAPANARSDLNRVFLLVNTEPVKAIRLADELLQAKPTDKSLRYMKARALVSEDKPEEGIKLLTELGNEGFAPALYWLASEFRDSDDEAEMKKATEFYKRYVALEPYDPRGFSQLAGSYEDAEQFSEAEAAYRKAIEIDPVETYHYRELIELLLTHNLPGDVRALLVAGEKYQEPDEDLFGAVMQDLVAYTETAAAKKLAAAEPLRMKTSARANRSLGEVFTNEGRYLQAERLLNTAVQISKTLAGREKDLASASEPASAKESPTTKASANDQEAANAYVALAKLYRKQSRWLTALKAANQAVALNAGDSDAHYQRACALARLRRFNDAIAALNKAIEIFRYQSHALADEPDLKPLSNLPAFKKLLPQQKEEP
jgi:tetratricopeptide (TPR) repeat protein